MKRGPSSSTTTKVDDLSNTSSSTTTRPTCRSTSTSACSTIPDTEVKETLSQNILAACVNMLLNQLVYSVQTVRRVFT